MARFQEHFDLVEWCFSCHADFLLRRSGVALARATPQVVVSE